MLVPKHHTDGLITLSWLQVFGSAQWARTGEGGEQQDHTQKQRSEKCGGGHRSTQATYAPEARFFGPQTPETPAVSFSPCPHSCKGLGRFSKLATSYRLIDEAGGRVAGKPAAKVRERHGHGVGDDRLPRG